ncbi:MAG: Tfp pilus assembly protein FimT/FimU [Phycisphaerales bacterium]
MMRRRGMTLLELMVVLAIVLALASVVAPAFVQWSRASKLPQAGNQVEALMMMAQADAQRQSVPVRVVARVGAGGATELVTERVELLAPGGAEQEPMFESGGAEGEATASRSTRASRTTGPSGMGAAGVVSATCTLPAGVSVIERVPEPGADGIEPAAASVESVARPEGPAARVGMFDAEPRAGILMAVFLPDGEAVWPGPRFLVDSAGRALEVGIEPVSGRVIMKARTGASRAGVRGAEQAGAEEGR